ncbi:uncharacterized protein LOC106131507 [Amyelois transitella]|uniref:uncharacterized protein LOC106131507 n=1 Tax=Amyelois transitella TaxID=680683 RepID=UPI00298FB4AA|nr:uncharacterized protein LOC106131507 [Amyelois transitella]
MAVSRYRSWCLGLRIKCFIIAYLNLFACIVDIFCHVLVVAITTDGFQCDVSKASILDDVWPWLEPLLLVVNIGTHGFYPLPLTFSQTGSFLGYLEPVATQATCYPGMFHVSMVDMLNFMINIIWLYFVKAFVRGVHKKDPESMRVFFGIGVLKLIIQILYFGYLPDFKSVSSNETIWFVKLLDIAISGLCLVIIYEYIKLVVVEKKRETTRVVDQPPPYIECLIGSANPIKEEKKEAVTNQPTQPDGASVA